MKMDDVVSRCSRSGRANERLDDDAAAAAAAGTSSIPAPATHASITWNSIAARVRVVLYSCIDRKAMAHVSEANEDVLDRWIDERMTGSLARFTWQAASARLAPRPTLRPAGPSGDPR